MVKIFLHGLCGAGKSYLANAAGPAAVVAFQSVYNWEPPRIDKYPWVTCKVIQGEPCWPPIVDAQGGLVTCNPALRSATRDLLKIPQDARVCHIVGEGLQALYPGRTFTEQLALLHAVFDTLSADFDVFICPFQPFLDGQRPDPDNRVITLHVPQAVLLARNNGRGWDGRGQELLTRDVVSYVQFVALKREGVIWPDSPADQYALFWHGTEDQGEWKPLVQYIQGEIRRLQPWYQHHILHGQETGQTERLSGAPRWNLLRPLIQGTRLLDVGANSGYMTIRAAEDLGCDVMAVEGDPRIAAQLRLALACFLWVDAHVPWAPYIEVIDRYIQQVPLTPGQFGTALLSCVHYHINRSGVPPYRPPRRLPLFPLLQPSLAVVIEDLLSAAGRIIFLVNDGHLANGIEEASLDWTRKMIQSYNPRSVQVLPGDAPDRHLLIVDP